MELFGCVLHCVETISYVKRHLKTSSKATRTKSRLEKDTYSSRKRHLFKQKNTIHSSTTIVGYFFYIHLYLLL